VLAGLRLRATSRGEQARARTLVLVWLLVTFLLVAVSAEQRMRYYLVLGPPAAVAVAVWVAPSIERWRLATRATAWLVIAVAMTLWQWHEVTRHNAGTSLDGMAAALSRAPAAIYAVDAPELLFEWELERPVPILRNEGEFARRVRGRGPAYLIVPERTLSTPSDERPRHVVAIDRVNHRPYALLSTE
jgi:hypothetical protein